MSPLIKSAAAAGVRRFADPPAFAEPREVPAPDPRAELLGEIERLQRLRHEDEAKAKQAIEAAREQGRKEGAAQAEKREADGLVALRKGLEASVDAFSARLDVLDGLAPELARTALDKLFADAASWAAPAEAMIARQLAGLRRASVVAIRVSPADFPDGAALAQLSAALAIDGVRVETDRELRAGASRIECKLGQIDLDARQHWRAVAALLAEMAE